MDVKTFREKYDEKFNKKYIFCNHVQFTGNAVSPFGRYASPFNNFPSLAFGREPIPIGAQPSLHDPWRK